MSTALSLQELDAEFSELLPEREALAALGGQFNFHYFHHVPKPCEPKNYPCPPVQPPPYHGAPPCPPVQPPPYHGAPPCPPVQPPCGPPPPPPCYGNPVFPYEH
ncbi:MAG: hypothetical protein ABSB59_16285 [Streptosporangiaceae bacterium]